MSADTLRVAHLVDGADIGGAESLLLVAARLLMPLGIDVTVLALRHHDEPVVARQLGELGIETRVLPSYRKSSLLDAERIRRIRSTLRAGHFDIVQTHLLYANVAGAWAARGTDLPVLATLHQTEPGARPLERQRELIEAFAIRLGATRAIAVGPTVADAYRHRLGRTPIDVVPNPIPAAAEIPASVRASIRRTLLGDCEGPLVLAVGRVEPVKGFDDLVEAFARVVRVYPGAVLAIAGSGSMLEPLAAQATRAGIERNVQLLGLRKDVPALLAAADLFVMSSHSEGRPFALLEAIAAGLPIVATAVGDNPGLVGPNDVLVAPRDPAQLGDAMLRVLGRGTDRSEPGCTDDLAAPKYDVTRWAEDMNAIYRSVAGTRAGRKAFRVVALTHGYKPRIGGIESQRAATMPAVARLGLDVHVVTRSVAGAPRAEQLDGVGVRRFSPLFAARVAGSLIWSVKAFQQVLRLRPDVLHADEVLSTTRVALLAGRVLGVPVIVFAHASGQIGDVGRNQRNASGRRLLDSVLRGAAMVVSVSEEIDKEFAGLGLEVERRRLLTNGVDTQAFAPASAIDRKKTRLALGLSDEFVAVFVGRLAAEKRLDRALAVWPAVTRRCPSATLLIVGSGAMHGSLRETASPDVHFVGSARDVRPYLHAADVLLLTSDREGLSCALLEAQACGLPAIVTDVGAARDVVRDGVNGFVVAPGDEEALQAAVLGAATNAEARESMGIAAREVATSRYALSQVAHELRSLYFDVARHGRKGLTS